MTEIRTKYIETAAKTIMSMCTGYLMGDTSEEMFVHNINLYADGIKEEYEKPGNKDTTP